MALPLYWRLILGYAAILLLSVGASLYSIVQLGELSQTARAALETDYRTIAQQETLTDAFLSEARYGGKYLITQAPASYECVQMPKQAQQNHLVIWADHR